MKTNQQAYNKLTCLKKINYPVMDFMIIGSHIINNV